MKWNDKGVSESKYQLKWKGRNALAKINSDEIIIQKNIGEQKKAEKKMLNWYLVFETVSKFIQRT